MVDELAKVVAFGFHDALGDNVGRLYEISKKDSGTKFLDIYIILVFFSLLINVENANRTRSAKDLA